MLRRFIAYLRGLSHRRRIGDEAGVELQFHLDHDIEANIARGMSDAEARRIALRDLGGLTQTTEAVRAVREVRWLADLAVDARHACRLLARDRGFSLIAILSLTVGIGASTIMFSVVDAALLRPLPYKNADRLVDLLQTARNPAGERVQIKADARHVDDIRAITQVFDGADVVRDAEPRALATGFDASLRVGAFTPTFLAFLGVAPQLGRGFGADDALAGDSIIISDAYWRRAFRGSRDVLGKTIAFSDGTCVVVGVMPPTFRYFVGAQTDGWVPLFRPGAGRDDRIHLVARIRSGLTLLEAQRDLNAMLTGGMTWQPIGLEILPADWNRAGESFGAGAGSTRAMLFSLLGAVGFLLAIGCANVGGLLVARTLTRQREIAIRRALGATRARIARQMLTESLVLAGIGAMAATVLASWGIHALPALVPSKLSYALLGTWLPQLDGRVLAFGCAVAIVTGVLCGVTPAIRASRPEAAGGLLSGGTRAAGPLGHPRLVRDVFLGLQVALTLVLLLGAGLLVSSVLRQVYLPVGFDQQDLGYAGLSFPPGTATPQRQEFFDQFLARLATTPSIRSATYGQVPVHGGNNTPLLLDASNDTSAGAPNVESFLVGPEYFRVVGIPLKEGRLFGPEDGPTSPPVAIISDNLASHFWPGRSAIGGRFRRWTNEPWLTVIGVVPHIRTTNLARDGGEAYTPGAQGGVVPEFLFRAAADSSATAAVIRDSVRAANPSVHVAEIGRVEDLFARLDPIGPPRFYAWILGLFSALGVLTAAIGLYGLVSYSVSRRTQEIGVRVALGAGRSRVQWLVLADLVVPASVGLATGLVAESWLSQFIASQLFRVTPHDPRILGAIVLLFLTVCAMAVFVPVRRAVRIAPADALRAE